MPRYDFRNDRLVIDSKPVAFRPARDVGGRIVPTLIVLHDTAGGLNADGSIEWLAGNPNKTSAHFVVARDGTITQLAAPDRKCNHAGQSSWRGREFCNGFAVGIEIVNPGKLLQRGDTGAVSSTGKVYDRAEFGIGRTWSKPHGGDGWWMPYTHEQLDAVEALVGALGRAYPSISEVAGHHDISPGRKVDPTPLMPWQRMRSALAAARAMTITPLAMRVVEREAVSERVDIEAAQLRLKALNYYTGIVDGALGTRTEAAVFAFQRENGLTPSGQLDPATVARLESDAAKPMPTGHREEATPASLAESGSTTMQSALADVKEGKVQSFAVAITGLLVAVKTLVAEAGVEILILAGLGFIGWQAWKQMKRGHGLAEHRLIEHKTGVK